MMDVQPVYTETITATLSASTGYGGSFTLSYPDGKGASDFASASRSVLRCASKNELYEGRSHYSVVYGASEITVTLLTSESYGLGEVVYLDVDLGALRQGGGLMPSMALANSDSMDIGQVVSIALGAPATADANGAVASQAATAASGLATGINGALAAGGVATFDVPRNVVAAWTGTAVLTVTGTDEYGNTVVESSASGASMAGKKAFKTVTGISTSADITGLTVGTGDVFGIPCYLADKGDVFIEKMDGSAATAGTVVAGVTDAATATTGDVRGTYDPNSAANGARVFELTAVIRDPSYTGNSQYAG